MQATEARKLDDQRRLVMPERVPPGAVVNVQQLDSETWLVKLAHREMDYKVVLIPAVDRLPDDPAWELKELSAATALTANLSPFE